MAHSHHHHHDNSLLTPVTDSMPGTGMGDDMNMGMNMWFTWSRWTTVLFESFDVYRTSEWALAALAIFAMALGREALAIWRVHRRRIRVNQLRARRAELTKDDKKSTSSSYTHVFHPAAFQTQTTQPLLQEQHHETQTNNSCAIESNTQCILNQLLDSFYYGGSVVLGYFLMLIIMSYNSGLFIVVVVSIFLAHFILHSLYYMYMVPSGDAKQTINGIDVSLLPVLSGDHCCPEVVE